jgi:plasmid stability protein
MASLIIRKLDEKTKARLRLQAAHHGCSMEQEAREILRSALTRKPQPKGSLAEAIHLRFAPFGGVRLEFPERGPGREPPKFDA